MPLPDVNWKCRNSYQLMCAKINSSKRNILLTILPAENGLLVEVKQGENLRRPVAIYGFGHSSEFFLIWMARLRGHLGPRLSKANPWDNCLRSD